MQPLPAAIVAAQAAAAKSLAGESTGGPSAASRALSLALSIVVNAVVTEWLNDCGDALSGDHTVGLRLRVKTYASPHGHVCADIQDDTLDVVDGEVHGDDVRTTTAIESAVCVPRRVLPPARGTAGRRVMIGWTYPDVVNLLETVRAAPTVTVRV